MIEWCGCFVICLVGGISTFFLVIKKKKSGGLPDTKQPWKLRWCEKRSKTIFKKRKIYPPFLKYYKD